MLTWVIARQLRGRLVCLSTAQSPPVAFAMNNPDQLIKTDLPVEMQCIFVS